MNEAKVDAATLFCLSEAACIVLFGKRVAHETASRIAAVLQDGSDAKIVVVDNVEQATVKERNGG